MYEYRCRVTVIDGDTVDVDIHLGFDIVQRRKSSTMGIDTRK